LWVEELVGLQRGWGIKKQDATHDTNMTVTSNKYLAGTKKKSLEDSDCTN
jgi:hypothetical protein